MGFEGERNLLEQEKAEFGTRTEKGFVDEETEQPPELPFIAVDKTTLTEEIVKNRGWGVDTAHWDWDETPVDPKAKPKGRVNPREIKSHGKYLQNQKQVQNALANDDDVWDRHRRLKAMGKPKNELPSNDSAGNCGLIDKKQCENQPLDASNEAQESNRGKSEAGETITGETVTGEVGGEVERREIERADLVPSTSPEMGSLEDWEVVSTPGKDHHISLPKVAIYKCEDTPFSDEVLGRIQKVFTSRGVEEGEIRVVDVTNDYEMQTHLQSQSGEPSFPIISICGHNVAGEEALSRLAAETGAIERHLQATHPLGKEDDLELGSFGKMLGAGETIATGMGSIISLPFSLLWSAPPPEKSESGLSGEDVEFRVVHTNWYYRRLHRIFRFGKDSICRLHPDHRDLRASHRYSSVTKVKYQDDVNIVIEYDDGGAPDYVQARKEDVARMVSIILEKNGGVVVDTSLG